MNHRLAAAALLDPRHARRLRRAARRAGQARS